MSDSKYQVPDGEGGYVDATPIQELGKPILDEAATVCGESKGPHHAFFCVMPKGHEGECTDILRKRGTSRLVGRPLDNNGAIELDIQRTDADTLLRERVVQTVAEMRSAVALSKQFGTTVCDHQCLLDWADQLEGRNRQG